VVVENRRWVDMTRATPGSGGRPASPGRALSVRLYVPTTSGRIDPREGPFPVFVWAHGFEASVDYFDPLLRAWAARGYVVVAPTFPATSSSAAGGGVYDDYVNQPRDVSFVITNVLAADGAGGSEQRGLVDAARIAVGGHSLGAVTTMALVDHGCCLDTRVKAAVAIDGSRLAFPHGSAMGRAVPTLLLHGDADRTFSVDESRAIYAAAKSPKFLIVMRGMPHTPFKIPAAYRVIVNSVGDFLDAYVGQDAHAVARLEADGTVPGVASIAASA
jgi:dipeptidyl aminopeptidase/acylaminoacyl peptidase